MRKTPEIWLVADADECCDPTTGDAIPIFEYVHETFRPDPDTVLQKTADGATLEQLVGLCDHDAENINAHDFCGTHRLLGAILFRRLGREVATRVMRDIAERRGLHGMAGICGTQDSYASLGVGEDGHDWRGTYD